MSSEMVVVGVVRRLREEILERNEDDWLIGLEEELQQRFNVSRPTLRQALRVLEHEGLVEVRRGVHGGLYGRIPTADAVTAMASIFLRSRGTTIQELMIAVNAVSVELARLATQNPDRKSLLAWVEERHDDISSERGRQVREVSFEFARRLAELSGNVPLALFEEVLFELSMAPFNVQIFTVKERVEHIKQHQLRLAEAVANGDADLAMALTRSNTATVLKWLELKE